MKLDECRAVRLKIKGDKAAPIYLTPTFRLRVGSSENALIVGYYEIDFQASELREDAEFVERLMRAKIAERRKQ